MVTNNFKSVFKNIEKSINASSIQALNRAITSTRAKYVKDIAQELKITSAKVKKRSRIFKASKIDPSIQLSIGTKVQLSASEFKPKKIKVNSRLGTRYGASYEIPSRGRVQAEGGFIVKGKNSGKSIIMKREGSSRLPLKLVRVDVFMDAVIGIQGELSKHMEETFKKNFSSNLKYNLAR